ncbi:LOW QUALITY PROTEIN: female sterile (1) K10 [Glossina fuscipes fuscipes]
MVSKRNFSQNGRSMQQQRQMPYKKPPLKPPIMMNSYNQILNASQIPDNPGYLDFNLPTPPVPIISNSNVSNTNGNSTDFTENGMGSGAAAQKKKTAKANKRVGNSSNNCSHQAQQHVAQQNGGWKNKNQQLHRANHQRFNGSGPVTGIRFPVQRNFPPNQRLGGNRRGRMMPPMVGQGPRGIMGPMGPPIPPPHEFQPLMLPPIPPMCRNGPPLPPPLGGQAPPPPFMRRGARPLPPPPLAMPSMMPACMQRNIPQSAPLNGAGISAKIKKIKIAKKVTKGKSTIKTLKNLINQYPIDKPWVTDSIRDEYNKKIDLEDRLKGNKDDELFAQFKVQRDKFVGLYETAREEYFKKEAAAVKAKKSAIEHVQRVIYGDAAPISYPNYWFWRQRLKSDETY